MMTGAERDLYHELAGLYALGALGAAERAEFEAHLEICQACVNEVRSFLPVARGLAHAAPPREPPAALRARVLERAGGARKATAVPFEAAPEPGGPESFERPAERKPRGGFAAWLVAAASFGIAAGLGWYTFQLRDRVTVLEVSLEEATSRAARAEQRIADARKAAAEAQTSMEILVAPDVARIDLAGQATLAPQATGRAFWSRSRGLVFTASALPPLPAGRIYQLWVLTAGPPISAGLLQPDATGRVTAVFQTPPDLPQPVGMAVTLEPAGGVPAPTGEMYLVPAPAAP